MSGQNNSSWHGKSGKEIFTEIQEILKRAENAATAVETIDGTFVFGYYQAPEPGSNYFSDDKDGDFPLKAKERVIYYDLGNLPNAYLWNEESKTYNLISIESSIGTDVNNIKKQLEEKVDKDGNKKLSTNDYNDTEKNKIRIIDKLSELEETLKQGQLFSTNSDETDPDSGIIYPAGLYIYTGEQNQPFRRVGGLL